MGNKLEECIYQHGVALATQSAALSNENENGTFRSDSELRKLRVEATYVFKRPAPAAGVTASGVLWVGAGRSFKKAYID